MIRQPSELANKKKKIRMLIAGYPGIGKSTVGNSAPRPLHIDVDFGADRIEPQFRVPFIQPQSYDEVLEDLVPMNVQNFDTLVFDTGGKLINLMALWAIKKDPKNAKRDGSLAIQGYGVVKREFGRLMDYCFYELDKNIVVLFHAIEEKDNDNIRLRLMVEGGTKNDVWIPMDLGGYMEMYGNDRTIGLSNCERYYAKGTRGINGILKIPTLTDGVKNDFLTKLFERYNETAAKEVEQAAEQQEAYEAAISAGKVITDSVKDAATANAAMPKIKKIKHALTSEKEVGVAFTKKTKSLGLVFNKEASKYEPAAPADESEAAE